jgi:hypothetical protein
MDAAYVVGDSCRGEGSCLNGRFEGVANNAETFASLARALPLNLSPPEKEGERGTHLLGRVADIGPRSAIFQREPVS